MRSCPVCNTKCGEPFFRVESAPVLCHRLCRTQEEALQQPRGVVELVFCSSCGLVFNRAFDGSLIRYDGDYENALHFSDVFKEYMERLSTGLVERYDVYGKTVAEIGCGDGQFLKALCLAGGNQGLGFDPAYDAARHDAPENEQVRIVPALFDAESMKQLDVGLVCCRQVLEHIERPVEFLAGLRAALGKREVPVFFEVPSAMHSLKRQGFWDVIYEHVTYFTPAAMRALLERADFEVSKIEELYEGQYLIGEARSRTRNRISDPNMADLEEIRDLTKAFGQRFCELRARWRKRLDELRAEGRRLVMWGAGSKTVMFLNSLSVGPESVRYVVDRNPRKQGCFIVGTGQQIIAPEELETFDPQVVVLLNPAYKGEVLEDLRTLGSMAALEGVE